MSIIDHYSLPDKPPSDFKQLKKELQHALFYFKRLLETGEFPSAEELERYMKLCDAFVGISGPELDEGATKTREAARDLVDACSHRDAAAAGRNLSRLFEIKESYHRLVK